MCRDEPTISDRRQGRAAVSGVFNGEGCQWRVWMTGLARADTMVGCVLIR
jgi:hypothetical protein